MSFALTRVSATHIRERERERRGERVCVRGMVRDCQRHKGAQLGKTEEHTVTKSRDKERQRSRRQEKKGRESERDEMRGGSRENREIESRKKVRGSAIRRHKF